MINQHNFERGSPRAIWTKFRFIKFMSSEEKKKKINQSEAMMTILDVRQGRWTRFW